MPEDVEIEAAPEPNEEPHEWWDRLEAAKGKAGQLIKDKLKEYREAIEEFQEAHGDA